MTYKWKKPRGYKVEEMLYKDRCMLKWHGMLLSDHNERIISDKISEQKITNYDSYKYKDVELWNEIINKALISNKLVDIVYINDNENLKMIEANIISLNFNKLKCMDITNNSRIDIDLKSIIHLNEK